jgi:hydroxymethylbilane synthase
MAAAALEVLSIEDRAAEMLDVDVMVPAVGQGIVAVEHRDLDEDVTAWLTALDDPASRRCVEVERAFLAELGSGCSLPVGAYCDGSSLRVFLADDGGRTLKRSIDVGGTPTDVLAAASLARSALAEVVAG